ncbi:hypothetical protein ACU8KH_04635 [Lachancea thermotolerans]
MQWIIDVENHSGDEYTLIFCSFEIAYMLRSNLIANKIYLSITHQDTPC